MRLGFRTSVLLAIGFAALAVVGTPWKSGGSREVVYVLDVSRSHGPGTALLRDRLLGWHARGPLADRTPRVVLAGSTAIEDGGAEPPSMAEGSRVDLGLGRARLTLGDADRIVVLSDGRFDHAAASQEARRLAAAGARVQFAGPLAEPALDMRLVPRGAAPVEAGVARIRVGVTGTNREPREVALSVLGGEEAAGATLVVLPGGVEEWEGLVPVAPAAQSVEVRIALAGGPDAAAANDALAVPLRREERAALLVGDRSGLQFPAIVEALTGSGWNITRVPDLAALDASRLAGADLLVLIDQPVTGAAAVAIAPIEAAVTQGGMGLWVIGGEHAFAAGGYAATRLDDLLPLSSRIASRNLIRVVLDVSGSMESRITRAVDAIAALAGALAPEDRLQVVPFSQKPLPPIPAEPSSPPDFLAYAMPALRRIDPRGGTRILPALDAALAMPRSGPGVKELLILVTDARDEQAARADLVARRDAVAARQADSIVVLLDPADETLARANAIATKAVIKVTDLGPRILVDTLEGAAIVPGPVASARPDGSAGPLIAWRNRVRENEGAIVALLTPERQPLMASAFRGAGRAAAWAAWPAARSDALTLAREWARDTARPAEAKRVSSRRDEGGVVISLPPASVPPGPLLCRAGPGLAAVPLRERVPGVFEVPPAAAGGPFLTLLEGDRILAAVPVPPEGDPEYAWPAAQPAGGPDPASPRRDRLRAPWAVLAALAWAAAIVFRRRRA